MKLSTAACLLVIALFLGTVAALTQEATKPLLHIICSTSCGTILGWVLMDGLLQIIRPNRKRKAYDFPTTAGLDEGDLIFITENPQSYSEATVRDAHLQLDEMYYNYIHQK